MISKIKVLITGAGAPGGPGIIKSLLVEPDFDIYTCDANYKASGRYLLPQKFNQVKKADDPKFIESILNICIKNKIDIVLPLVTKELNILSQNIFKFQRRDIKVIVSDFETIKIANNKGKLYDHLKKSNLTLPKYFISNNLKDINTHILCLGYPKIPVVVKPCIGNGSRGIRILDSNQDSLSLLLNEKPNSLYMEKDAFINTLSKADKIPNYLVSEFLPGNELTIDTIIHSGKMHDFLIRTRDQMRAGISISGRFIKNEEVKNYVDRIISTLPGLNGPVGFQVKQSFKNKFLLLECNPRIQGTSVAAKGLGVNLVSRAINLAIGNSLDKIIKTEGVGFNRYYEEIFYDY